jgi:CDP-6-deoxy-D-xylo-4-hexulose-3-dehydrase
MATARDVGLTNRALPHQIGVGGFVVDDRAKELVAEVLESGRLTAGPMMARFEAEIAKAHGARFGLMCNSGTSAMHIALGALREVDGWEDGDEVLVPAITFVATANVVLFNGLRPVFVDVDPQHYTIDPELIAARITPRTRAIMPVHVGGLACDMDPILEVARAHGLRVVEDCAEAMFATYGGRPVGSFSDIAAFSTYAAHIITTGVGGLCTTDDPQLLEILESLMNHGRDPVYTRIDDDQAIDAEELPGVAARRFRFPRLGHSFRATEMEAAVGLAQLESRDGLLAARRRIAERYGAALGDLEGQLQLPATRPGSEHVFMFYALMVTDPERRRDDLVAALEQRGIETRPLLPLIDQPVYRQRYGDLDAEYPVAASLNANALYVGCHPEMTERDVDHVVASIRSFFEAR